MTDSPMQGRRRWASALMAFGLALAMLGAFLAYLRPEFVVDLAGRMFLCS